MKDIMMCWMKIFQESDCRYKQGKFAFKGLDPFFTHIVVCTTNTRRRNNFINVKRDLTCYM